MRRRPPRSTLFPYTTLFRSRRPPHRFQGVEVDHDHLGLEPALGEALEVAGHPGAEQARGGVDAVLPPQLVGVAGGIGLADGLDHLRRGSGLGGHVGERVEVHLGAGPVGHHHPGGELGQLAGRSNEHAPAQPSGRSGSRRMAARSVPPPVDSTTTSRPWAAITSIAWTTDARHEAVENGRTMPVVPRMEMPPTIPSRGLVVLRAMRSPPGTEISQTTPAVPRSSTSPMARLICARGTGLIAGPPTSRPRPGLVTVPTPSPARQVTPGWALGCSRTVRWAPWVTSGSSPASFTTTASAQPSPASARSTGKRTRCPPGRATSTSASAWPPASRATSTSAGAWPPASSSAAAL